MAIGKTGTWQLGRPIPLKGKGGSRRRVSIPRGADPYDPYSHYDPSSPTPGGENPTIDPVSGGEQGILDMCNSLMLGRF